MTIETIKKRLAEAAGSRETAVNKQGDYIKLTVCLPNSCKLVGFFPLTADIDFNSVASQCTENEEKGASNEIYIIEGSTVIPGDAFSGSSMTSLTIPGSVDEIGSCSIGRLSGAFEKCRNLRQVIICEGVKSLGRSTFENCESLESVILPQSLSSIGKFAFRGCKSLKIINLPDGLTKLDGTFEGCESIERIDIPHTVTEICDDTFCNCSALKEIAIPEGVTQIGDSVFEGCTALKEIAIPEGVTQIGGRVFKGCSVLKEIIIPNSVAELGRSIFYSCPSIEKIALPLGLKKIGFSAFQECTSLKDIVLPEGISTIEVSTFENCPSLESVTLPDTLTSIDREAFQDCAALKSIKIPEGVNKIGNDALRGCTSLESANIPADAQLGYGVFFNTALPEPIIHNGILTYVPITTTGKFIVKDGVQRIEDCTFSGSKISEVFIPESVTEIGEKAFYSCKELRHADIQGKIEIVRDQTFAFCEALQTVNLPEGLVEIGRYAFKDSGLISIIIPEKVNYYSQGAFDGCKSLQEVTITNPDTSLLVSNFDNDAFSGCTAITNVILPKGLTWGKIKVKFPDSPWSKVQPGKKGESALKKAKVEQIENVSFELLAKAAVAPGQAEVVMEKNILQVKAKMDGNSYIIATLSLKDSAGKKIPLSEFNWEPLKAIIAGLKEDTTYLLYPENTPLTKTMVKEVVSFTGETPNVVLLPGINEICNEAFDGYKALRSIVIPDTVTSSVKFTY